MKIALDAMLLGGRRSGVEQAILSLARALAETGRETYRLYAPGAFRGNGLSSNHFRISRSRLPVGLRPVRIFWEQCLFPLILARDGADLLHAPGYIAPLAARPPVVLTVYDLIALRFPRLCTASNALHYRLLLPASVRKAAGIIVPSRTTRDDLVRFDPRTADRIRVIPPGLDPSFRGRQQGAGSDPVRRTYGLAGPYILFVGRTEPKKNVETLVEAFAVLKRDGRLPHKLVLAGARGWAHDAVVRRVRRLGLEQEVVCTGFVPAALLPDLYGMADVFVFPSLYEGFGLPPLEAMACGTPVIVSDRGALPETTGSAAVRADPRDPAALARAVREVLTDAGLKSRLIAGGLRHAADFSWDKAAAATEQFYRDMAS